MYLPDADVNFNANVELHGSIMTKTFLQNHGADVYYDASLRDANLNGISSPIHLIFDGNTYAEL